MSRFAQRRPLAAILTLAACSAALTAQGIPVGFAETYALAKDRAAVVAELIPGTADWYYYHCRERLDARDFETVRKVLPTWIKRHGRTARVIEIENREALLSYGDDQERTYDFLRQRLGLQFRHERIVPGARSDLATRLDPSLLSPTTMTQRALSRHRGTVDGFTSAALARLCSANLDDKQLHSLLKRLDRPDVPNLPNLIVRDLSLRVSRGFGSLNIHNQLRKEQLDQCAELRPDLLQNAKFVAACLKRMQPDADTAWYEDTELREKHLQRVWTFARSLSPSFNSLKAHVLYHWLRHDLMQGAPDKERFLAYIRLPRRGGFASKAHMERFQKRAEHVDLRRRYPTLLGPIGNDTALVRACLEQFFVQEDSVAAYSDHLDRRWLEGVLAETKLLAGIGDQERWYSLLDDPARLERLEKRVELRFPATMKKTYGANDAVRLVLDTKNVKALLVKVFEIDTFRYHVERQKPVDATIDLDGVVANFEQTFDYSDAPMRRVRRTFDLPMLRNPGTYVVDFVGNGISSRAVIHKGELRMVERTSAAGQLVRIYDEAGQHLTNATAWFGGREYGADDRGEILLPFSTAPGKKQLVLRQGNRSSITPFTHRGESYSLKGSVHVDRESILAGNTASLVLRPQLHLAEHPVSLSLLEQPLLTIIATDLDGKSTTQEVRDLALVDGRDVTHAFQVPTRMSRLDVRLTGRVQGMNGKPITLAGGSYTFNFNQIDKTAETGIPMLVRTDAGYAVELRGKSGEVQRGRVCRMNLYHRDYRDAVQVALQTDANGRIQLGRLPGIYRVQVTKDGGSGGTFDITDARVRLPGELHGITGGTIRIPYQGNESAPTRTEFSLLGNNHDAFEHLAIANGFLELRDLDPGDYELRLHRSYQSVTVRITRGERDGRYLIGRDRALSATPTRPLHVTSLESTDDAVRIRVANASEGTRVHVVATRYLPAYDLFAGLRGKASAGPAVMPLDRLASTYDAGRKLSDEYRYVLERRFANKYPGNMLDRPSLLLNPMALDQESWNSAVGLGGGAGGAYGGRARGRRGGGEDRRRQEQGQGGPNAGVSANLDYLPEGSQLLSNLTPDENGYVTIPLAQLGEGQHVHVLALDGAQAVYDTMTRAETRLEPRSRVLPKALDSDRHYIETRRIEFIAAGTEVALDAQSAAEVEVQDSLGSAFQLFTTIRNDPSLQQFAFLLEWPGLDRDRKLELYGKYACHELHFFLHQKDPEFFRTVVRPFLANKLDKTFLDEWLLERDLRAYLEPWRFAKLNLVEKILLAKRIGGDEPAAVARMLAEALEIRPIDGERIAELFDLSLLSDALEANDSDKATLRTLFEQQNTADGKPAREPNQSPRPSAGLPRKNASPAGPKTGGPAGPSSPAPAEKAGELAKKMKDSKRADEELHTRSKSVELEESEGAVVRRLGREMQQRKSVRNLYTAVDKTRLLVEHNYWQRKISNPTTDAIAVNQFWLDFASAKSGTPFVSPALVQASNSFVEMMFALSVLDLPFEAGEHQLTSTADQTKMKAASPLLLVRKEIAPTEKAKDSEPMLLGQNFFRLDDRYRWVNGKRRDAFVTDEFLVDVAYGCQVVVTNPTSSIRMAEVLLQVPEGAVPLQSGFWTRGRQVMLAPYATQTIEYSFYFPAEGSYDHYPVHAAEKGKLTAFASPRKLNVVAEPSRIDTTSWEHVSQQGTPQEVLQFLQDHNVQRLDLSKIAWRMRDRAFYQAVLPKLKERHAFDLTLWSYAVLHRDAKATAEYLRHRDDFLDRCGTWLDSPLANIDPKERARFQHLELSPLVHQRAHQLGSRRVFGNRDLANQYSALMNLLGYRPKLDSKDWLAVTYYFLLQDRIEEALESFGEIDPNAIETKVQYDYLSAYLCFFTGDMQKARRIATAHEDHVAMHWRKRFREVLTQLDEAEGKTRPQAEEQTPANLAATAPALELAVEGRNVAVSYKNLSEVEVRYYELDVEFAFSAQPFAGPDGASAAFVKPNFRETRTLPKGATQLAYELPQQFWQKNVLVEVRAGGLVRSRQYFANALDVRFLESYGQVAVTEPKSDKPLAKTYVKVFARLPNGTVRFHKDGYTDLRGRFDYASLSDDPNRGATRYAVLVLDEQRGAVIREINPPAR